MRAGIAWSLFDMLSARHHTVMDTTFAHAYGDLLLGSGFLYAIHTLEQMNGGHDHTTAPHHHTTNRVALMLTNVLFALCALEDVAHIGLGVLRNG